MRLHGNHPSILSFWVNLLLQQQVPLNVKSALMRIQEAELARPWHCHAQFLVGCSQLMVTMGTRRCCHQEKSCHLLHLFRDREFRNSRAVVSHVQL